MSYYLTTVFMIYKAHGDGMVLILHYTYMYIALYVHINILLHM